MTEITLYHVDTTVTPPQTSITEFYQWDVGQTVARLGPLSTVPTFHFCNCHSKFAYVVTPEVVTYSQETAYRAQVPNVLLQESERIIVYIYLQSSGGVGQTIEVAYIPVVPRPRPDDYEYIDDTTGITLAGLDARITALEAIVDGGGSGGDILDGSITTQKLADGAVTSIKLANSAVIAAKLATDAVETNKIKNSAITTAKLNDSAVTRAKVNLSNSSTGILMAGATASAAGKAGCVPAPGINDKDSFLRGDGTWVRLIDGDEVSY